MIGETTEAVAMLEVTQPDGTPLEVYLKDGETIRVGRIEPNDVVLIDRRVSRFHASVSASGSGLVVCDLSSMNGTFVNGSRISTPRSVNSGDIIAVGDTVIKVTALSAVPLCDGQAIGDSASMTLAAEMKAVKITVMLADVCSYTRISAQCPAADVTAMLQRWLNEASDIVRRHGGIVDKYIGDCVMAFWRDVPESACRAGGRAVEALRAGLEIRKVTQDLVDAGHWPHEREFPWRCRVALNSGDALMGSLGGSSRHFTVVGDCVNVAFKIEDAAGKLNCDVVMSEGTAGSVSSEFAVRQIGTTMIDGRNEAVPVYTAE